MFITTLLNPKGLVFAFLIFPGADSPPTLLLRSMILFLGICAAVGSGWLILGAFVGKQVVSLVAGPSLRRAAALVLALFGSVMLLSIVL